MKGVNLLDINERVQEVRKSLKMSRKSFGEALGVSGDVINNIESNRLKRPEQKEPLYMLICKKFDVNEEWLRTGKGEMFIKVLPEDELATYCAQICAGADPFIESAILEYMRLDENSKSVIRKMVCSISERMKKKETGE